MPTCDIVKQYSFNGQRHRVDGSAVERADGTKFWYQNGQLHREGRPAIEYSNGIKEYWVNGRILDVLVFWTKYQK